MVDAPLTGDVVRLTNHSSTFRRRVGSWRVFFDVFPDQRLLVVNEIVRRTTTTYRTR
jgi:mRNA-degrading endonuclease RelE of RelBE toxin-antitoxin system